MAENGMGRDDDSGVMQVPEPLAGEEARVGEQTGSRPPGRRVARRPTGR